MTDTTDIADRMRAMANDFASDLAWCDEAADTIEALRARVENSERASKYEADLCQQALDDMGALRARIAELERDAARYRWLRDNYGAHAAYSAAWFNQDDPALFDSDIDAAMKV